MPEHEASPHQPRPRSPFPWMPLAIVALGVLFLLLAVSVSFNVYWFATAENPLGRMNRAREWEHDARVMRAEVDAARALLAQQEAERKAQALRKQIDQGKDQKNLQEEIERLRGELDETRKQLGEAKRQQAKQPEAAPQEWGTLEGRVVFEGELPKTESLEEIIRRHADAEHVLKAPKDQLLDPTWRIDAKTKGVANVCVYLKRPKDGVLPIHADDKIRKGPIVMDAPFCVYVPHMAAVYPEWFDGKDRGDTGQKFIVKNSSPVAQNARLTVNPMYNEGYNRTFLPKSREQAFPLRPQPLPVLVHGDVHPWMDAFVWVFDHPYFAISKADGTFIIPRVPASMEVQVMAWHESQGWLFAKEGKAMTLKQGKNMLDLTIGAK